ncbi:vitamin K-dependent gamma-carboxylase-like [Uloborus diversus]|uniref:vitamin K-dependent gamma-carboxylase-like n=1 Tax=Uloborus diversus TaxID=327109 RepID=UPI002408F4D8|nr:vitamin K-dependent gamma-carboxylase-like [Uloborus diversus]
MAQTVPLKCLVYGETDEESRVHSEKEPAGECKFSYQRIKDFILREIGVREEELEDFYSFSKLLHSPRDPSNLALIRILYGLLMIVDTHHERGLSSADTRWGNQSECRFPLFDFLKPLPLEWMVMVYLLMLVGAVGIMLGYRYRFSCLCFLIPYWYIFLLDKSHWNNHSYLFGLLGIQLMLSGANRCWSLDGKWNPNIRHSHVPLWNYALLRGQIFLVYFIAGLKKTNLDWIGGYSMEKLGYHWVFDGFRLFLTDDQITYFVVHLGGFLLDLTVGFLMLMSSTRPFGFLLCGLFNSMNSRMFSIGMFPYVMIAVMPIFCSSDWPKRWLSCSERLHKIFLYDDPLQRNTTCIYAEEFQKHEQGSVRLRHQMAAVLFCLYFTSQVFLPYSHWLTKGYNTWTQGLYGYSWDMMVHHWYYVHTTINVVDKDTGRLFHLDPEIWTRSQRWTHHADMVKQFARCVQEKMEKNHELKNISLYMDVWVSLNKRFAQRMYDPTVDLVSASWSPFQEVTWVLPLQAELTDWRESLIEKEEKLLSQEEDADILFLTDFPGFHLLNFVSEDFQNITLEVLKGVVEVRFGSNGTFELYERESVQIPSGEYHVVSPQNYSPACYMYLYHVTNKTEDVVTDRSDFFPISTCPLNGGSKKELQSSQTLDTTCTGFCWQRLGKDFVKKSRIWARSMLLLGRAFYSILTKSSMVVEERNQNSIAEKW